MREAFLTYCLCVIFLLSVKSQDIHFSQAVNVPLWQTPAAAGMMNADYRFSAIYKNQWSNVPVPFNSFLFAADGNILSLKNKDKLNAGIILYNDRAGDSKLSHFQAELALSYAKTLGDSMHYLSGGFMIGTAGRSFSISSLLFDNQYVDGAVDPSVPIDEVFNQTSFSTVDLGAGLMYSNLIKSKAKIDIGFGIYHLNTPEVSFYGASDVKLNQRYHFFASADIYINPAWQTKPLFVYQRQDSKQELIFGNIVTYRFTTYSISYMAAQAGIMYRNQDALVTYLGFRYNDLLFGLSYDINTSPLTNATNGNGGIELSAVYQISRVKKINTKGAVCPIF